MQIFKYIALLVLASTIQANNHTEDCTFYDKKLKEYYAKYTLPKSSIEHKLYSEAAYKYYVGKLEECYTSLELRNTK